VRQRSLKKLRAKNYDGSDEDWTAILTYVFGSRAELPNDLPLKDTLDVTCSISGKDPKTLLTISLRNKVEEITQQLGAVELPQTEETDDIDLFGWAAQAIQEREELRDNVLGLQGAVTTKEEIVTSLQKQLDELVEAKAEHEHQLLSKFTALLNEKKLKIRQMQRVLSTAQADPRKLRELQTTLAGKTSPSTTRRGKRLAEDVPSVDNDSEESEAFENMEADNGVNEPQADLNSSQSGSTTPSTVVEEEEDEGDGLEATNLSEERPHTRSMDTKSKSPSPLPPQRELPFQKKDGRQDMAAVQEKKVTKQPAPVEDDEETASEDDEL
jgi:hypothetical protein